MVFFRGSVLQAVLASSAGSGVDPPDRFTRGHVREKGVLFEWGVMGSPYFFTWSATMVERRGRARVER